VLIAFHKPYGVLSQFTPDGSPNRPLAEFDFPKGVYPIGRLDADSEGLLLLSDEPEWNARLLEPRRAHEREYWAQVERIPTIAALEKLALGMTIQGRKTLPCRAWLLEPQPIVTTEIPSPGLSATLSMNLVAADVSPLHLILGKVRADSRRLLRFKGPKREPVRRILSPSDGEKDGVRGTPTIPPRAPPIRFRKSVPDCWIGLELIEGKNRQVRRMTAAIGHPTLRLLRIRIGKLILGDLPAGQWKTLSAVERRRAAGE
jgi:pseudouridine synthase